MNGRHVCLDKSSRISITPSQGGVFYCSGEYFNQSPICNDTRHSDDPCPAEGFKEWRAIGLEELGRQVVLELMQDWMNPLLTEGEQDRLVGWHLGVSL